MSIEEVFYNAQFRAVRASGDSAELEFEYLGNVIVRPTWASAATSETTAKMWEPGKVGVVRPTNAESDFPEYRFEPYADQSLRRAFELDAFERIDSTRNVERNGWRNALCPDGFLAPAGLIPGTDGQFIADDTERVTIDVPRAFFNLCAEYHRTPEQVLRGFIADVCSLPNYVNEPRADGYSSNGSDERSMAYDYLERAYAMWRDEYNT